MYSGDATYPAAVSSAATVHVIDPTTTKLSAPSHGTAKHKITVKAKTAVHGRATLSGTVVFRDNGKRVASVKEKSTGTVSVKIVLKTGSNTITAAYTGSATCAASEGTAKVSGTARPHGSARRRW
jgi:uncharacterized protein (DUF2252 family)